MRGKYIFQYQKKFACLAAFLHVVFLFGAAEQEDAERKNNFGEDITRPLNRVDVKFEGQEGVNCLYADDLIATVRTDLLIKLAGGWKIGVRGDLPYAWYWTRSRKASCYTDLDHIDDSLLQVIAIAPTIGKWTYGFGVKAILPTAGDNLQIGDGKYQLLPSVGVKYDLGEWSEGAYAGVIVRQAYDVAGYRSAPYICKTYIQPFFNMDLTGDWFINCSPELIYNWRIEAWFIPFDVMVGKMVTQDMIVSFEYQKAIVYDYKQFTQSLEFRVGYFY